MIVPYLTDGNQSRAIDEIIELDFLRDTATISVSYEPKKFVAVKEPVRKEKVVRAKEVMG